MNIYCGKCGAHLNKNGPTPPGPCRTCAKLDFIRATRAWVLGLYRNAKALEIPPTSDGLFNRQKLDQLVIGYRNRGKTAICMAGSGAAAVNSSVLRAMFREARAIEPTAHLFVHATRCLVAEGDGFTFVQINPKKREVFPRA